jgi:hypothetical protein
MIVFGIALTIVAVLLIAASAIVSDAVSAGSSGCTSNACPSLDPGPWFDYIGLPLLALGVGLLVLGLLRTLR